MKAEVTSGDMEPGGPSDIQYTEVTDPQIRASIIAHAIRIGKRPVIGSWIGFSRQLKEVDSEDVSASGDIDITKASAIGEKVWCRISVTAEDVAAAHALINDQRISYREAGGKVSQIVTMEKADEGQD